MNAQTLGYLRDLVLATESPTGAVVNLVILLLFVAGLVDCAAALGRLRKERTTLRQARSRLAAAVEAKVLATGADVLAALNVPKERLVSRRVERILQLRSAGSRHPGVLRELTGDRLAGFGALGRYIGTILTLLGLLGTVLGLSFALFNIQGALGRAGDLAALKELIRALDQTLLGMRTAFACTLAGLSTALLLSSVNHAVSRLQARLAADLEEFVSCELLPVLERIDPGADEAARAFAGLLVEAGRDLGRWREEAAAATSLFGQASQQIADGSKALEASVESFGRSVGEIAAGQRAVAETSRETGEALRSLRTFLAELTEHHRETLENQLRASQEAYESSLARHMQELQTLATRNREAVTDLAAAQTATLAAVSDLVLDVRTQAANSGSADAARSLAATVEASHAAFADLRGLAARFEPAVVESQQQHRAATETALAEIRSAVTQLLGDLTQQQREAIAGQVQSLETALATALDRHAQGFDRVLAQSREGINPLLDAQGSALRVFSDLVLDVHSQIGPLFERLSHAGNGRGLHQPTV